ncbi:MAG TPA: M20/M25/M40 family metallo-hydrolase [Jiangellales bacterium]|nr:M20/M25/M40 family metallo-hydrolase [Jiangellales bacterium]
MRHARRYGVVAATAALALAGGSALTAPAAAQGQGNPKPKFANTIAKFTDSVTADGVYRHLEAFQEIADEHGGNRASGLPGYEASAQYVTDQLEAVGYEVEWQEFEFPFYEELSPTEFEQLAPTPTTYVEQTDFITMTYSGSGEAVGQAVAVDIDLGAGAANTSGCEAADFNGFPVGEIALMQRGSCAFGQKAANAEAAGASGAIIFNSGAAGATDVFAGTLGAPVGIPVVGVSTALGVALQGTTVRIATETISENRTTWNIIAETEAGRDDNVVMLGAHLDTVTEGAGINDNGSGSAGILEVAIQLAKVKQLNNTVRFAWWGAEELGLIGSYEYVDSLSDAELGNIATYLNFDMIASPNYIIGVYDADQSTYTAPVPVPAGSPETEDVFTDYFDSIGQPWVDTEFSGRSDYQAFILAGVPASGLFTGADGVKTAEQVELFGGQEGVIYDPNYHTPEDDITNVDIEALEIMSKAIAHATITLAFDTSAINGKTAPGKSGCAGKSCDAPGQAKKAERAAVGHTHDVAA